jgi:hypothetical protein
VVLVKIEVGMVLGKMVVVLSVACCAKDLGCSPLCGGCCAENQQLAVGKTTALSLLVKNW